MLKFYLEDSLTAITSDEIFIISKNNNNILLSTPSLFLTKNGKTITFLNNNLELQNIFNSETLGFFTNQILILELKNYLAF